MSKRRSQPSQAAASSRTIENDASMVNQVASGSNAAKTNQKNAQAEAEPMAVDHALDDANISDDEEGGTRIGDIYIPPPVQPYCSTESKGPRLIIKKIVNNNFKSYAGKVVLGPFHHCFTAIIGPNGSGKSNVIDSMLFVFGYRANKIRCKKISTLLHNSALYPNMSSCSVAVHFRQVLDKDDGSYEELPDSEIVIERVAFRDNSSYYNLNGKRAQFKEVAKLLKSHNVDLDHNRFLILQGEVESIAMMKPKGQTENEVGMLEYLEDIVGTTRYKEPLRKINERVEQLTEERTEKHNRCQLAEREMKDLEQPFNDAVNYLRMENDHTRTKNLRIQKYISEKNKKLQLYTEEYEKVETELKNHDEEAANVKKEREEKEGLVRKEMEQYEGLRKKKEDLQKAAEKARSKYTEVQQTMSVINNRRKKDKAQITKCTEDLEELKHIPEKNEKEIEECKKKVEQLNKKKDNMEEELQKNYELVEEQTKPLIEQREKLETELIDLKRNVDTAKGALAQSETELRILKHEETTEKRKYETMKNSYESSENDLKESRERVETLNKLLPDIQKDVKAKSEELKKLVAEEEQMRATLMKIKSEVNEKTESMRATRSNNKVLDFLMRQKNEGHIPGILGRLGDLGGIDSKYDVAISTACGRLDNIIVETVEAAQECIEKLKKYDVGRASFIALEKIEYLKNHSHPIKTPENAPRLYDLVRVEDERVLPAFYFALRNTLVATDMDQARRLAYGAQRFRVVTLTGGVIETSGTMSGGGRTMIRGKMGTKVQTKTMPASADGSFVSQKDLEEMQVKAEQLQSKINYSQEQQGRLEREIYQLNADRQKYEGELQKLTISIKSLEEQISRIFKQVEAQKKRMQQTTSDPEKVKTIESEITKNQKNLKESENEADKVSSKIKEFKEKIEGIHGDKVKSVQKGIANLNTQIKKLNNHISKLNVEVTTSERNVIKLEKQIESLQAEILKAQDEITNLNAVRQECDEESTKLDELVAEAEKAIQEAKSGSSGIQKEILALQKRESDSKLKRVEIEQQVQTALSKLNDVKHHIPKLRDQLKPLQLNKIPDEAQPQDPLKTYTEEELATHSLHDLQFKESVEDEALKKKPNLSYIQEYMDKRNVYIERVKVLGDITLKRNEMRQLYDDVRKKRYNEFMQGFHIITRKLKEMYQMITQGGDAELELVDSLDPFTEGVSFSVRPPKKSWKNISNLSGGEKTLSSLALVFALHYYKPSPLYFMDEIDAALDFKNISIVAHYIKERTKNAQFIIISLRSNMFELADWLVGIYKVRDCTDTITIKNFQQYTPMPITQTQQNIAPSQNISFGRDQSMITSTQESEPTPAIQNATNNLIDRSNDENSPMIAIMPSQGRETTFAPNAELQSTALSIQGRDTTFAPNAALQSTGISILNTSAQSVGARTSSSPSNAASINDDIFKKPLPPQPAVSN